MTQCVPLGIPHSLDIENNGADATKIDTALTLSMNEINAPVTST